MYKKFFTLILSVMLTLVFSFNSLGKPINSLAVKKVSLGNNFSSSLLNDGSLWIWGELFDGTTSSKPIKIEGINDIKDIESGTMHCTILKEDGTVWVIGNTYWLDREEDYDLFKPYKIDGFSNIEKIDSGKNYILALKKDGMVMSIGENYFGQLGNGTTELSTKPSKIDNLKNIVSISAGYSHSFAVDSDGKVWSWGSNEQGQLSRGPIGGIYKEPGISAGLSRITDVKAGEGFSVFLKEDGSVYSSGINDKGQLGLGNNENTGLAKKINDFDNIKMIDVGSSHVITLKRDSTVYLWGENNKGQVNESFEDVNKPFKTDLKAVISVYANGKNSAVLKGDNKLWFLGDNSFGQFGDESIIKSNKLSKVIQKDILKVGTGNGNAFSIDKNNKLYAWGLNYYKQINDSNLEIITEPTMINLKNVKDVDSGQRHTIVLLENGEVYIKGDNTYNQLGNEDYNFEDGFIKVDGLSNIKKISAGEFHNLAVDVNNKVYVWGKNTFAQLGNGDYTNLNKAFMLKDIEDVIDVSGGEDFSVALDKSGNVWTWGDNQYGQLGYDSTNSNIPIKLENVKNIESISTGRYNVIAIDNEGNTWVWGKNQKGELGISDKEIITEPTKLDKYKNIRAASCGDEFSALVNLNNELLILGEFDLDEKVSNVKSIECGMDFILINKTDGNIYTVGANNFGQLGINIINKSGKAKLSSIYKEKSTGINVLVNSDLLEFDVDPIIKNSRTLVPLRGIFEYLNVEVTWDGKTRTVTCTKDEKKVVVKIDNDEALVDGKSVKLDAQPIIKDGRTLVPLRFVSESLGAFVDWDNESRTVIVVEK